MLRSVFRLAACVLLVHCLLIQARAYDFVIKDYAVETTVKKNNVVEVHETIQVEFFVPRHGIYRVIPIRNRNNIYSINVLQNGRKAKVKVKEYARSVDIRIGDKDKTIIGPVKYDLYYRVFKPYNVKTSPIEVSVNLLGTGWSVPVEHFSFRVKLPAVPVSVKLFCGRKGSRTPCGGNVIKLYSGNHNGTIIAGETLQAFPPGYGITLYAYLPAGSITNPGVWETVEFYLVKNPVLVVAIILLLLMHRIWRVYGRDEKRPLVVQYTPPEIPPVEAGIIYDDMLNGSDIASILVDWCRKGIVEIREIEGAFKSKDYEIRKLKELPDDALPYERKLFTALFNKKDTVTMKELAGDKEFARKLSEVKKEIIKRVDSYAYDRGTLRLSYTLRLFTPVVVLACVFYGVTHITSATPGKWLSITSLVAISLGYIVFAVAMARKNRRGAELYARIAGFVKFFEKVEKPVIDRLLAEDPNYPIKYFPYAVALDLTDKWDDLFSAVLSSSMSNFSGSPRSFADTAGSSFSTHSSSSSSSSGVGGGSVGGGGGGSW